jgi:hypothetical protein
MRIGTDVPHMRITFSSKLVCGRIKEGSSFDVIASFFNDGSDVWSASTPTNARYRIDRVTSDPNCYSEVLSWQTLTPATSNTLSVTGAQNALQDQCVHEERRQITVEANSGLSTAYSETFRYWITNLAGITS